MREPVRKRPDDEPSADGTPADRAPAEPRARSDWLGWVTIVLGLGASSLWSLFLLWVLYSAAIWLLS